MTNRSKYIIIAASLILLGSFLFPIWNIDLHAPQYPEGIGLRIWANKITGQNEFDLNNINKLNHYIGMKKIKPESIPELEYMPYIIVFFSLFGLAVGFTKNKKLLFGWIAAMIITLMGGLYDFYMWGYDYGHNLNSNAPLKIPGMYYQPPLIGSKQLLNINAVSLPGIGSILIFISLALCSYVLLKDKFKQVRI